MHSGGPYTLQVQVPSDFSAIAIITLHPAAKHIQSQQYLHEHWATKMASALKAQESLRPLLAYSGELFLCLWVHSFFIDLTWDILQNSPPMLSTILWVLGSDLYFCSRIW